MAISPQQPHLAIGNCCIEVYHRLAKLGRLSALWGAPNEIWQLFGQEVVVALDRVCNDGWIKRAVWSMGMRLAARSAAVLRGASSLGQTECPFTRTSLLPPRIALVGSNLLDVFCCVHALAEVAGFPLVSELPDDRDLVRTIEGLRGFCGRDDLMFKHGILYLERRRTLPDLSNLSCVVVVATTRAALVPPSLEVFDSDRGGESRAMN